MSILYCLRGRIAIHYSRLMRCILLVIVLLLSACTSGANIAQPATSATRHAQPTRTAVVPRPGSIYVATVREDASAELLALQPEDGGVRWRRKIGVNTPALLVVGDVIYVVGGLETLTGSRLSAFNAHDGSLLWQTEIKSFGLLWLQSANGLLYLAGPVNGTIYAVSTNTGTLLWQKTITKSSSLMTLTLRADRLYATSFGDGSLYSLNAQNGSLIWKYQAGEPVLSQPEIVGTRLYLKSQNKSATRGELIALDLQSGKPFWRYQQKESRISGFALIGDQIIVASANGTLTLLQTQNGAERWHKVVGTQEALSAPLVSGEKIVVVSNKEHAFYAFTVQSGVQIWRASTRCEAIEQPRQAEETFYLFSTNPGQVCAAQFLNGNELWQRVIEPAEKGATFSPFLLTIDQLYIVSPDTGIVYMFHRNDGTPGWQYNLGAFEEDIPAPVAYGLT